MVNMLENMGQRARAAANALMLLEDAKRSGALYGMAQALEENEETILAANQQDMENGKATGMSTAFLDRLLLTSSRIKGMAEGLRSVADMPDPLSHVQMESMRPNGLYIRRVSSPMGVIGVIFESRPNVAADSAGLCLKAGSAVILRGGKEAIHSTTALVNIMRAALKDVQLPEDAVQLVEDTSRDSATALMTLKGYVDLLIPRGGGGLIQSVVENAKVPVLQTGEGVNHIYIDKEADIHMAADIVYNAKVSRPSVCNAVECLLIHKEIAHQALPLITSRLISAGVELRGDAFSRTIVEEMKEATPEDYGQEFLSLILAVKSVANVEEAVEHIRKYGTMHSEAIVTSDDAAAQYFFGNVDAASVYHNASTRFTDGGEFGFGAEIGISTQKLHARGPVGLHELTTYRYLIEGNGQIR